MVLTNYVTLQAGVPATLHFTDHAMATNEIRDKLTGLVKPLTSLQFVCDRLNGQEVGCIFSVSSEKLAQQLAPYLPDRRYRGLAFTITKSGSNFLTEYQVKVAPFA